MANINVVGSVEPVLQAEQIVSIRKKVERW